MHPPTRLRTQALALFVGVACAFAALPPLAIVRLDPAGLPRLTTILAAAGLATVVFFFASRILESRAKGLGVALATAFAMGVAACWAQAPPTLQPAFAAGALVATLVGLALLLWTSRSVAQFDGRARTEPRTADVRPPSPPAVPALPAAAPETPTELYDRLVRLLGFDSAHPGWFPALRELHRHSREKRLQLIPDFFYTSVFSPKDLPPATWERRFAECGTFDLEAQRALLREAARYRTELAAFPVKPPADPSTYFWENEQFSHADAALYYAFIRKFRPKRIVEVGSGHSTKLALSAVRANGSGSILCVEPYPPPWLKGLGKTVEIQGRPVQEAPDEIFLGLEPSDILFIDGSHISKTGSDVNHLFLRILPRLPAGTLVQIHDICLPFEYQRYWSEDVLCYWNEQYVLAALLSGSEKFEVLAGVYFLQRTDPEALRAVIPELPGVMAGGGSLWLRVRS